MKQRVTIVIPAYNEGENCVVMADSLDGVFARLPYDHNVIFVDDGSADNTLEVLERLAQRPNVGYLSFSRNFGHQAALMAGLAASDGDCTISMDCDMQHPPELIGRMLELWQEGYEVVYTRRMEDRRLPLLKRLSSKMFYKVLNSLSSVRLEDGAADFRLTDRTVTQTLASLDENEPFIRGLVSWIGFRQCSIAYNPGERVAGQSKYTLGKMVKLAVEGVTSFSVRPLHIAAWVGFVMALIGVAGIPYVIWSFVTGNAMAGWSSLMVTVIFFCGVQLIMTGIMGIYLGKLFVGSKHRPRYIIRKSSVK